MEIQFIPKNGGVYIVINAVKSALYIAEDDSNDDMWTLFANTGDYADHPVEDVDPTHDLIAMLQEVKAYIERGCQPLNNVVIRDNFPGVAYVWLDGKWAGKLIWAGELAWVADHEIVKRFGLTNSCFSTLDHVRDTLRRVKVIHPTTETQS